MLRASALSLFVSAAGSLAAETPFLDWPIDCTLGRTCFIEDFVDADPGPGQSDYTCGVKSRNDHRGTDIALLSFDAMEAGVDVLAAADGVVAATRDDMPDRAVTPENRADIAGRECGNAIRLRHANGSHTLYCHLRQGSLRVTQGQTVTAGQPMALVGLSGLTNYPHLHIGVLRDGAIIDPFAPTATGSCGTTDGPPLWTTPIPYAPTGLFTAGFATSVPEFDDVKSGTARATTARPSDPLLVYGFAFHAEQGDVMHLSAFGPAGETLFDHSVLIKTGNDRLFRAYGRRAPAEGWPKGAYRGYARLMRGDTVLAVRHADLTVQ